MVLEVGVDGRTVDLHMVPQAIALAPIEIRATPTRRAGELGGFYERALRPVGRFIAREQFEQ